MKKKNHLQGYKQHGKKLISPMNQFFDKLNIKMMPIIYINDILPEVIWVGLIYDNVGYQRGLEILHAISNAAQKASGKSLPFAVASSFQTLSDAEKERFVKILKEEEIMEEIRSHLAPLIILYKGFPLQFIGVPEEVYAEDQLLSRITHCVEKVFDKNDTPGVMLYATIVLSLDAIGCIECNTTNVMIQRFKEILHGKPGTGRYEKAASFFRAFVLMLLPQYKNEWNATTWSEDFWNQGSKISPCVIEQMGE